MLRLLKYLKPYTSYILISIALLFLQANADLALPDYMSKIVNIGIQQGGVENAVPVAIRKSEMDRLGIFMSPEEKALVLGNYTLSDKNSVDYTALVEKYPVIASESVYIRTEINQAAIDELKSSHGESSSCCLQHGKDSC